MRKFALINEKHNLRYYNVWTWHKLAKLKQHTAFDKKRVYGTLKNIYRNALPSRLLYRKLAQ